jgi:hypothetical protein
LRPSMKQRPTRILERLVTSQRLVTSPSCISGWLIGCNYTPRLRRSTLQSGTRIRYSCWQ